MSCRALVGRNYHLAGCRFVHCWVKPNGYDTGVKLYNCITKQKEPLIVRNKNCITWYTCGPTVYDSSHIGHASCYVKLDIIQRILRDYFKYNLVTVMNITDIDNKIIRRAYEKNVSCADIVKKYEDEFWKDMTALRVAEPSVVLRVTENMKLIVDFIQKLVNENKAYQAPDNSVYFSVDTCKKYGKLQNIGKVDDKKSTIKRSASDFALWKSSEDEPFWSSPWGNGRPGWHIECSALASKAIGSAIDIHAGGIDLRFPHHENEEAQSCAYHDTSQWVNYWIHTGYLHKEHSEKMSKSLKNTVLIQDMLQETTAEAFRMACVLSNYRSNMEFSRALLKTADNVYGVCKNFITTCDNFKRQYLKATVNQDSLLAALDKCAANVHSALQNDFDTPLAMKHISELMSVTNSMLHTTASSEHDNSDISSVLAVKNFVTSILSTFGVEFKSEAKSNEDSSEIVNILNEFRQNVRITGIEKKDKQILHLCDDVRDNLKKHGIIIRDHGKESSWSY
nr:unnamed protein product [Callosobruchus chinensis]